MYHNNHSMLTELAGYKLRKKLLCVIHNLKDKNCGIYYCNHIKKAGQFSTWMVDLSCIFAKLIFSFYIFIV